MTNSWWAQKLGMQQRPVQQAQPVYPQQVAPQPHQHVYSQPQPQQQDPRLIEQQLIQMHKNGQISDAQLLIERTKLHGGNKKNGAARYDTEPCPECGGMMFSRQTASAAGAGAGGRVFNTQTGQYATVAPICTDCGYRGGVIPQQTGELFSAPLTEE